MTAQNVAYLGCALFFLNGLATGIWKYRCMAMSNEASAPTYVDICHRASLMYSFAALVLAKFAELSAWSEWANVVGVVLPLIFFATAIASYMVHGLLRDTDNQLRQPHQLGSHTVSHQLVAGYIYALAIGEIGGFLILATGYVRQLFQLA